MININEEIVIVPPEEDYVTVAGVVVAYTYVKKAEEDYIAISPAGEDCVVVPETPVDYVFADFPVEDFALVTEAEEDYMFVAECTDATTYIPAYEDDTVSVRI